MMPSFKEGLSIVVPLFNEAENIERFFKKIDEFQKLASFNFNFILVDGCSSDGTPDLILREIKSREISNIELIPMNQKNGYGYDIMRGLANAKYDVLSWTHADLQTDLKDLIRGYEILISSQNPVIVKGKRINRALMEKIFTFGMQVFTYFYLGVYLDDINAQPKLFRRSFYEDHLKQNPPNDFSLDLFLLLNAKLNGNEIKTFNVAFNPREAGTAKGGGGSWKNRINLIKRTIKYIIATKT